MVNGITLFNDITQRRSWHQLFDLSFISPSLYLEVRIISPTFIGPGAGVVGVAIENLEICIRPTRGEHGGTEMAYTRFSDGEQWFTQPYFLHEELLQHPERIPYLNFLAGEPFLIKGIGDIPQYLIDADAAQNVVLQVTTNATTSNSVWLPLTSKFKKLMLTFSIDGFGPYYEYIRQVEYALRNIHMLKALPAGSIGVSSTFQIYNALNITDLFRCLDSVGIQFYPNPVYFPAYLRATAMLLTARRPGEERLWTMPNGIAGLDTNAKCWR